MDAVIVGQALEHAPLPEGFAQKVAVATYVGQMRASWPGVATSQSKSIRSQCWQLNASDTQLAKWPHHTQTTPSGQSAQYFVQSP
jgi:hypothetical protein